MPNQQFEINVCYSLRASEIFPVQCVLVRYVVWVRDDVALRRYAPDHLALKCQDAGDEIQCNFRLLTVLLGDANCCLAGPSHHHIIDHNVGLNTAKLVSVGSETPMGVKIHAYTDLKLTFKLTIQKH